MSDSVNPNPSEMLASALDALDRVQAQLESERAAAREPIAVVGLGCRFPGADDAQAFAAFLDAGGDAVREIPGERAARFEALADPALRRGGFFEDVAGFDAAFFGASDAEALAMDPQQRMLLEVAWQALEDAGEAGGTLAGTNTGVYLGLGAQSSDYAWWLLDGTRRPDRHAIAGSFHSLMPGRLSYLLDLRGPSLVVDAACASGLVTVHLACQALRRRECDAALAAAVNLVLSPAVSLAVQASGLWSGSGGSRAFDASADGFVRGEGCAVLVLKRLSDAIAQGDAIRAVIHGSAVAQDGRSNGLTAPNGPAQEAVVRRALHEAGVPAAQVGYVEAHATGTRLGDAIEAEALDAVYGTARAAPLLVGALKPSLGHLEAASGMAALVKAVLAVEARAIPPTLHHAALNPDVAASAARLAVVTRRRAWPEGAPYAGVSAFGMSGTNAHLIVGPAPSTDAPAPALRGSATLRLSAHDEPALRALSGRIAAALRDEMSWPDVCASLESGRRHFAVHVEIRAEGITAARAQLREAASGALPLATSAHVPKVVTRATRKVRLPTYPFQHRRFWPVTPSQVTAPSKGGAQAGAQLPAMLSELQWRAAPLTQRESVTGEPDVIHFCSPDGDAAQRERSLGALLRVVREMAQSDGPPRRLFVVSKGASAGGIDAAMALSIGRTVALEHPDLRCRSIEIDADLSEAETDAALAEELEAGDGEQWVRRSIAGRLVPRVMPLEITHRPFTPRAAACHIVTGGFGGIGRMLAGWLVERGATDILLLGRTVRELPEAAEWRERGARIRCIAADVADPSAVAAALAPLVAERVPIAGVFHAAGIQDDALLFQHDWPRFAEVLRAKVDGARVLQAATRDQTLDAFVLFSSVGALCGLVGAGAYVAANAALGALARQWRTQGVPALSVQWGTWQGSGMANAGGTQLAKHWEALGILPFDAASGTTALEALMASGRTEAIAANIVWARLERWARTEGIGAPMYRERVASEPPAAPAVPATRTGAATLRDVVRESVAKVLGLPPDHASLDRSFGELGLGSLAAIELRTQLTAALGIAVPATLAFNHPSVDAVVKFLGKRLQDAREPVLPAP